MSKTVKILTVGDVVGQIGCDMLRKYLPSLKREYQIDVTVVNGENSAQGNGITRQSCKHIFDSGADVVTTGNHVFRRKEIYEELDENPFLIRPANYPPKAHGCGCTVIDRCSYRVGVANIMGVVYMDNLEAPFACADRILDELRAQGADICLIDIHAEATSEKRALAFYVDGRASAVFGTHTHVQTADETVLPSGTGYITDLGMTGPEISVLGVKPELAIARMTEKMPVKFENADGPCILNGCVFEIDLQTKKTVSVKRIFIHEKT